jgi:hypothetical protein
MWHEKMNISNQLYISCFFLNFNKVKFDETNSEQVNKAETH